MFNVIPRPIQELYLNNRKSSVVEGIILYADMSGFTSITESLLEYGKNGAAVLSGILNRVFSRAINEIYGSGGIIAEFEGDAIIAVFPASSPEAAYHAATCLQRYFDKEPVWKTDIGEWPVSIKLSLSYGQVEWGIIGEQRLAYFIKGSALVAAAELSAASIAGTIGIHPDFIDIFWSTCGKSPEELTNTDIRRERSGIRRILKSVASEFVSESVLSSRLTGEFRSVTPIFINIRSKDDTYLRECVSFILSAASVYGGDLNGLYCSNHDYATALVLFGAPVSWENNTSRAFDFSHKLLDELGNSIRAGISEGTVYAGITGSSQRCVYTVYGDTVNTAARLVSIAEYGEILVTEKAIGNKEQRFTLANARRWLPRGKSDDILIGELDTLKNVGVTKTFTGRMLGRSSQMRIAAHCIEPVTQGSFAGAATVYGEPGIGKSRLLHEISQKFSDSCQTYVMKCDDILKRSLNPFVYFLKDLFQQSETGNQAQNARIFNDRMIILIEDLRAAVSSENDSILLTELERASSIIGSVLGHFWLDSVFSKLAVESRFENTALALKTLVKALSRIKPTIFIIEDLHWMDSDSRKVIDTVTRNVEEYPFILLFSSRYFDDGSKPPVPIDHSASAVSIDLKGIDRESVRGIIVDRIGAEPGDKLADFILSNSSGNPFYTEQFCLYLMESDLISEKSGRYHLTSEKYDIPSGIKSILVARMDRLPHGVREFLQTASVLGQEFNVDTLNLISRKWGNQEMLDEGERLHLWSRQSGSVFSFNHALYRDTAYGMLLGKSLHKLHSMAAEVLIEINRNNPEPFAAEIALHLKGSLQISRAIDWGWRALCHASKNYRNNDILEWSDRLKDWLISQSSPGNRNGLLMDVLLKKDSVLHSMGNRQDQRENIELMSEICSQEKWIHRQAELLKVKGAFSWITGDLDSAFSMFRKGLEVAVESSDPTIKGKLYGNIANLFATSGDDSQAREYYDRALVIHRELASRREEGVTLGNLAILLRRNGRDDEARECYEKALALHRETGNRIGEGRILCGLGHLEDGPEDALKYYRDALKINREIGDRLSEAIILSNLGRIETMREKYEEATGYLDHALGIHRQIDNSTGESDTHCLFGEMYYFMRNWSEARKHLIKAIAISRRTGNSRQECIYQGLLGLVNFEDGNLKDAIDCYIKTYKLVMGHQFPSSIDDSLQMLRDKLIAEGITETEIPYPDHW